MMRDHGTVYSRAQETGYLQSPMHRRPMPAQQAPQPQGPPGYREAEVHSCGRCQDFNGGQCGMYGTPVEESKTCDSFQAAEGAGQGAPYEAQEFEEEESSGPVVPEQPPVTQVNAAPQTQRVPTAGGGSAPPRVAASAPRSPAPAPAKSVPQMSSASPAARNPKPVVVPTKKQAIGSKLANYPQRDLDEDNRMYRLHRR